MKPNDGGPAHPIFDAGRGIDPRLYGMSLRDYFAAAALAFTIRIYPPTPEHAAADAYRYADAMLKERGS